KNLQRVVPRHDMPGNPMRFAQCEYGEILRIRNGLAMQFVDGTCVELEVPGDRQGVSTSLTSRLAGVLLLQGSQFIGVVKQRLRQAQHQTAAGGGCHSSPIAFEGMAGCLHRATDFRAARASDLRYYFTG